MQDAATEFQAFNGQAVKPLGRESPTVANVLLILFTFYEYHASHNVKRRVIVDHHLKLQPGILTSGNALSSIVVPEHSRMRLPSKLIPGA